jgi:O-antigen ligase
MFCLAPLVFGREKQRNFLLAVLVAVGAYIGLVNLFEGVGLRSLVVPSYINDASVGIHFGRARGPFVESVADGLSLFMCAVAAGVGLKVWRRRWIRAICVVVIVLAAVGILFTVTRAVWVATIAGTLAAMVVLPGGRRLILPVAVLSALGVALALALVPGLDTKVTTRLDDKSPIWDRFNTNDAAIRMVEARPIFGFGWQTFPKKGPDYLRQADTYPMTGAGLEVHDVFLSHAAELGLVGAGLWAVALLGAVVGAIVRRGPPTLVPWRVGLLAILVAFLAVAAFGPLSYPFPNLLLWTWAGIAGADFFLAPETNSSADGSEPSISRT